MQLRSKPSFRENDFRGFFKGARRMNLGCALIFIGLMTCTPLTPAQSAQPPQRICTDALLGNFDATKLNPDLRAYEAARVLGLSKGVQPFARQHGWEVISRDGQGGATKLSLRILVDNPSLSGKIRVVGSFNNWGKQIRAEDLLSVDQAQPEFFKATLTGISHGDECRLEIEGKQVLDPSAVMFTTPNYVGANDSVAQGQHLNSVFYDLRRPSAYQMKNTGVDLRGKPVMISENEVHAMSGSWRAPNGKIGPDRRVDTYKFIAKSGIAKFLKVSGINAVEMLPFNQSVDGESWHLRYQVFGLFAPDSQYGTPDDFKMMIDAFHNQGIAVIMDSVVSHFPFQGNMGLRELGLVGLDKWLKADGRKLYAGELSPWNTYRYDYSNPYVRRFLVESIRFMLNEYRIDGVRFDNVDGIRNAAGGELLLKEITAAMREENPAALAISEAFFTPNSLVQRLDQGGTGMNTKTDSNIFELWKNQLPGRTENISAWSFYNLLQNIWSWQEVALLRYLSNHDEASNGRSGLTGAYPASLLGPNPHYVFHKLKMADALNMVIGSDHMSIPQARLMQTGSFYSSPNVQWGKITREPRARQMWNFFARLNTYIQSRSSYFNFASLHREIANHYDDDNKVLSIKRTDQATGKSIYILINMGHREIKWYQFGISRPGHYRVAFDSDLKKYGGTGQLESILPGHIFDNDATAFHGKPYSLIVPLMAPYSVTIFEPAS